jgi:DNA mismatch endonuclease, patch repair protein
MRALGIVVPSSPAISAKMSKHPRRDTRPELGLRRLLHAAGFRYRVQYPVPHMRRRTIDIAFTRRKLAVFVDGCFWHRCPDHSHVPTSNYDWWQEKFRLNGARDADTDRHLRELGWHVVRLWEHQPSDEMFDQVCEFLSRPSSEADPSSLCEPAFLDGH